MYRFPPIIFIILLMSMLGSSISLPAQERQSREELVVRYSYNIALNVVWPNEGQMTKFRIVFIGDGRELKEAFNKMAKVSHLKNRPISFISVDQVEDIPDCEMVILSPLLNAKLQQVYAQIGRKAVLIMTMQHKDQSSVMINLIEDKKQKRLTFEVNRPNILFQRLQMQLDLVKWGGKEIDVAEVYKQGMASLVSLRNKVEVQESQLKQMMVQVEQSQAKIDEQRTSMTAQQKEIEKQKEAIGSQKLEITEQTQNIAQQKTYIQTQQQKLQKLSADIEKTQVQLKQRKLLYDEAEARVQLLKQNILAKENEILAQEKTLAIQKKAFASKENEATSLANKNAQQAALLAKNEEQLSQSKLNLAKQKLEVDQANQQMQQLKLKRDQRELEFKRILSKIDTRADELAALNLQIKDKNQQIISHETVIASQRSNLRMLWGLVALALAFLIIVFYAYRNKRRFTLRLQEQQLELQATLNDLRLTQHELIGAKEVAVRASAAKSSFLANMSHEIRTPMNAILGFSEILTRRIKTGKDAHYLSAINASGRSLLRLINDILDLSKVEAGKFQLELKPCMLTPCFREMKQVFIQKAEESDNNFLVEIAENLPPAAILDETRVRQVVFNLVGNALKFTKNGDVKLLVSCSNISGGIFDLHIAVADTGVGIPKDQQAKVFGAFEQMDGQSYNKFGGTGLGLAISKKLVELMNGEITLKSEPGVGTTFSLTLRQVHIAQKHEDPAQLELETTYHFKPAKVLVVDDIAMNIDLIRSMFDGEGLDISAARNGIEAVKMVRSLKPDIVLMDLKMPKMDGLTASKHIREFSQVPVIMVSASAMANQEGEIRTVCNDYLRKPVKYLELAAAMAKFLPVLEKEEQVSPEVPSFEESQLASVLKGLSALQADIEIIKQVSTVNEVMTLQENIRQLVSDYPWPPLCEWFEQYDESVQAFAIDQAVASLTQLEQLIEQLQPS